MTGRAALLVFAVAFAACQGDKSVKVDFSDTPRNYFSTDYGEAYLRWTRHDFVLREVEKALEVWATYKSWDFREAYVEHYVAIYSLSDADKSTLRNAQRDAVSKAYEFHVTAQSANYKWNDLEKTSSPWRGDAARCARPRVAVGADQDREAARGIRAGVLSVEDAVLEDLQRPLRRARGQ